MIPTYNNSNPTHRTAPSTTMENLSSEDKANIRRIILDDPQSELLVKCAQTYGQKIQKEGLSTSQIRNIFSEARRIEFMWGKGEEDADLACRQLRLLQPKLAYQQAKQTKKGSIDTLAAILTEAINVVLENKDTAAKKKAFDKFMDLFEAILAYFRQAGGK